MMEKIVNLFMGCVRMEAKGAYPANILNRMARAGIDFWDAEPAEDFVVRFTVRSSDQEKVARIAGSSLCTVKALEKRGSVVLLRRLRRRRMLLACLAICLLILGASSLYIWDIEVTGNEAVSDGEILRALEECGVSIGSFWPNFSSDLIRNSMILKIPELRWMTVNVSNSRAEVIVRERVPKPEIIDNDAPVSVTARKTGIIKKMNVLQGRPAVGVGNAVVAGETLVTGVMESPYADTRHVHAMAEIEAAVWYELTAQAELFTYEKAYSGRSGSRWALNLGGERINFYRNTGGNSGSCDKITLEYPFALEGVFTLPITLVREEFPEYELVRTARDETALESSLEAELISVLEQEMDGRGEVISSAFSASKQNGLLIVTLRAECREDIAVETPFVP